MPDPKLPDPRFRPLLRKVTPGYQERLDEEEGLYDRARLGSGQRILERLNRGLGY